MLGICASGGYVVPAAATDRRIKAVATVSGVDLGTWYREGADGKQAAAVFQGMLDAAASTRTAEARGEGVGILPTRPASEEQARAQGPIALDGWEYYCTDHGRHPRQADHLAWTSIDRTALIDGFSFARMIAARPLLMIVGTEAVTRWLSEKAFQDAHQPKELFWIAGATHVGLYYSLNTSRRRLQSSPISSAPVSARSDGTRGLAHDRVQPELILAAFETGATEAEACPRP